MKPAVAVPHPRARPALLALVPLALTACLGEREATAPAAASRNSAVVSYLARASKRATPEDAQVVARSMSLAMANADVRRVVLNAMRQSRVNEHKIVLQDFVATRKGRAVLDAAAAAIGIKPNALQAKINGLPHLDFYALFEKDRLSWKGTPDVLVATTFDPDVPTVVGYGTKGDTLTLSQEQDTLSDNPTMSVRHGADILKAPLLILHPEEPKLVRGDPQPDKPGDVIQDPGDGASASTFIAPAGNQLAQGRTKSGGRSLLLTGSNISINHFNIKQGDGWFGSLEMRFHSYAIGTPIGWSGSTLSNASRCDLGSYEQNGVNESQGYDAVHLLSPGVSDVLAVSCPGTGVTGAIYGIQILEDDHGATGGDDDFGWGFYTIPANPYPFNMQVGLVESFYVGTWDKSKRSAYFRIIYT